MRWNDLARQNRLSPNSKVCRSTDHDAYTPVQAYTLCRVDICDPFYSRTVGWISHNIVIVLILVGHLVIEQADIIRPSCNRVVSTSY